MRPATSSSALNFQNEIGEAFQVLEFGASTRSAAEAAATIGCDEGQIAKSIIFRGKRSDACILAIAPGPGRIDTKKVADLIGEPVERPDADFVRERTGYAIGGVPPLPRARGVRTLIARELAQNGLLWAAGGTPNAVFSLDYAQLQELTGGESVDILTAAA